MRFVSGLHRPKATVLGNEFAGEVEAVGGGVTSFTVGDRVFGYNEGAFGAHAEYMTIPERGSVAVMPANSTFEEAAAGTEGALRLVDDQGDADPEGSGRSRLRRDRSDRFGSRPS